MELTLPLATELASPWRGTHFDNSGLPKDMRDYHWIIRSTGEKVTWNLQSAQVVNWQPIRQTSRLEGSVSTSGSVLGTPQGDADSCFFDIAVGDGRFFDREPVLPKASGLKPSCWRVLKCVADR